MASKRPLTPHLIAGGVVLLLAGVWLLPAPLPRDARPRVVRKTTRPTLGVSRQRSAAPSATVALNFDGHLLRSAAG